MSKNEISLRNCKNYFHEMDFSQAALKNYHIVIDFINISEGYIKVEKLHLY